MNGLSQALQGMKVLDFSQGVAGPHAACLLAEMGAEVVKVEPPWGDWLRGLGVKRNNSSVLYGTFNRGKRGLSLDLKQPSAREAALHLMAQADVVIESYRPGVMKGLGLDFESARALNPRVVYLSISGFGQTGPHSDQPATDAAVQAFSGFSFGAGDMVEPVRVRISLVDVVSGVYASQAILGALLQRGRLGQGQYLDVSLMHCITAVQAYRHAEHEATGGAIRKELFAAIGIYRTSNGYLAISAMRDKQVTDLIAMIGKADLLENPRLNTAELRFQNQDELRVEIGEAFAKMPNEHWLPRVRELDLICQDVLSYDRFRAHPQVRHQEIFMQADLGEIGRVSTVRMPGLAAGTATQPAPRVGQDTIEVLCDWGVPRARAQAWVTEGGAIQAAR